MSRFIRSVCLLGLALGACRPLTPGGDLNESLGFCTVFFDKNGADVPPVPSSKTIRLPETRLDGLPTPPGRAHHRFVEWNTARDGSGATFNVDSPVDCQIATLVYAQWKPVLNFQVPASHTFTPMADGNTVTFKVVVSGIKTEADADNVELQFSNGGETWFHLRKEFLPQFVNGDKTYRFRADYYGTNYRKDFNEGPVEIRFFLSKIPEGYEDLGGTQTLLLTTADGLTKERPIPVSQANMEPFNDYAAHTANGRKGHFLLVENVRLPDSVNNWTPIGTYSSPFTGSFDGGGHVVFGLNIYAPGTNIQGFFGYIGKGAEIKNLGLEDVSVTGGGSVGGVVGWMTEGTVQNCHVTGNVSGNNEVGGVAGGNAKGIVRNSYATAHVSGNGFGVGGVVGHNFQGTVQNCHATGHVGGMQSVGGVVGLNDASSTVQNCYATGDVSGNDIGVGGVVGVNDGASVRNSYATGNVYGHGNSVGGVVGRSTEGNGVYNCYATGNVSGMEYVGGVAGENNNSMLQNCYATGNLSGTKHVGGVVGVGSNYAKVQNCVALSPNVTQTINDIATIGRVLGYKATNSTPTNNHARSDMQLTHNNGTPAPLNSGPNLKDGGNASAGQYGNPEFWSGYPLGWDFSAVWQWGPSQLPILQGVGGEQNPTAQ